MAFSMLSFSLLSQLKGKQTWVIPFWEGKQAQLAAKLPHKFPKQALLQVNFSAKQGECFRVFSLNVLIY